MFGTKGTVLVHLGKSKYDFQGYYLKDLIRVSSTQFFIRAIKELTKINVLIVRELKKFILKPSKTLTSKYKKK